MEIIYMNSYLRVLKKIKDADLILDLNKAIANVEKAETFAEITNVKNLLDFQIFIESKLTTTELE